MGLNRQFEFATSNRIVFGEDALLRTIPDIAALGRRAFVVTGRRDSRRADPLVLPLRRIGVETTCYPIGAEPTLETVAGGARRAREAGCGVVIGMGGGSVIDAAKAVAAMQTNPGDLRDYLEVIGNGKTLAQNPVPCVAIPTTAGTGSEVTRNAVLKSEDHRVKVSLRSPGMLPVLAIVDPVLTRSMPPAVTASTGMDALTQLIEPFLSNAANPLTDGVCREGLRMAACSLQRAFHNGGDARAREGMALASLFGGLALANARLGAVHGIAGPLGGMFPAPHGVVCARLLAPVMRANLEAVRSRLPDSPVLGRFDEIARILTGDPGARAEAGVRRIGEICDELAIPPLSRYGLTEADVEELVANARQASSMKGNPVVLTDAELGEILRAAM
ncbi:MAG TPA: iron-containing alcohol dehydrogenase [bacterium]|nr:iron-containing alcohol dehydrogenase [bacterium]